jgi:hypothetical protein
MLDPLGQASAWPSLLVSGEIAGVADPNSAPYKIFRLAQADVPLQQIRAWIHSMPAGDGVCHGRWTQWPILGWWVEHVHGQQVDRSSQH